MPRVLDPFRFVLISVAGWMLLRRARDVFAGLREGWLKPRIDRTFPLTHAAEAHQLLESRQTAGKLILNC